MAGDSVTLRLDGEVTIDKLSDALARFAKILEALGTTRDAHVEWVLADLDFGSAVATARAVPLDAAAEHQIPAMYDEYLSAAQAVARGDVDPSRPILRLVRDLTEVADERIRVVLETAEDEVAFDAPARQPGNVATTQFTKSLGTVRGRVETLSHRGALRFSLYELATDKSVSCYLASDLEDIMRDAWGRVADVTGMVTRDAASGRPLSIRSVTQVDVVNEGDSNGFLAARGALRLSKRAEQIVRHMRDAG